MKNCPTKWVHWTTWCSLLAKWWSIGRWYWWLFGLVHLTAKTLLNIYPFIPLKDVKNTSLGPEITFYLLLWRINEYVLSVPKLLLNYVACEGSESYGSFLALKTCLRDEMTRLTLCHQSMQNWLVFGQHQNLTSFDVIWCHLTSLLIWWWVSVPIFVKFGRQELLKDQFVTWSEMHE